MNNWNQATDEEIEKEIARRLFPKDTWHVHFAKSIQGAMAAANALYNQDEEAGDRLTKSLNLSHKAAISHFLREVTARSLCVQILEAMDNE